MPSTDIALSMEASEFNPEYDASAKKLLSYKDIVAWLLKLNTGEFRDIDVGVISKSCIGEVSVSGKAVNQDGKDRTSGGNERAVMMNSESSSISEGTVFYDLRLMARAPGIDGDVCVFVNIEIQNEKGRKYSLVTRGLYYCARMISEQHGTVFTGMDYQKIRKVYSIWISPNPEGKRKESSINRYSVSESKEKGNSFINRKDYDKMEVVVIRLGSDCEYSTTSITGMLDALLSSEMPLERRKEILERVYGIPMTKELESEVTEVCNLSSAVMEAGRESGLREGRKSGLKEGRKLGRIEGRKEGEFLMVCKLVDNGRLPIEEAADSVVSVK